MVDGAAVSKPTAAQRLDGARERKNRRIARLRARVAELEDVLRRVEARHGLSVQDFGAVGDGEHDDTDAINRCHDFMASISRRQEATEAVHRRTLALSLEVSGKLVSVDDQTPCAECGKALLHRVREGVYDIGEGITRDWGTHVWRHLRCGER